MKSLKQVEHAFLEVIHIFSDQKGCSTTIDFLVMHQTIVDLISHFSAVLQTWEFWIFFTDKKGDWNIFLNWLERDLPSLKISWEVSVSILLESTLLQVLSEVEQRTQRTAAWVMAHVDNMTITIIIGCMMFDIRFQYGAHEGKHIAELDWASVDTPRGPEDFSLIE